VTTCNTHVSLLVEDNKNCQMTDTTNVQGVSGVQSVAVAGFKIFPVPARNELVVHAGDQLRGGEAVFSVHDLAGQKLAERRSQTAETLISLEHLPAGVYIVSLRHGEAVLYQRFIKAE
jgi:hypothetical protein